MASHVPMPYLEKLYLHSYVPLFFYEKRVKKFEKILKILKNKVNKICKILTELRNKSTRGI